MAASSALKKISITVKPTDSSQRIDLYLSQHPESGLSRNQIQNLISLDKIHVNSESASKKYQVKPGDIIEIEIPPRPTTDIKAEKIELDIRFEDEHLAVINKPAGMVIHPAVGNYSGTLVNALLHHFKNLPEQSGPERAGIVHRLDKNTSGLLLVAKSDQILTKLQEALQKREVKRNYTALVCGHVKDQGDIEAPIGRSMKDRKRMVVTNRASREALTRYKLVERFRTYDLLDVSLQTGRTHQIRVHFAHIGHPVFGDPEYGGRDNWHRGIFANERKLAKVLLEMMPYQALHSRRLEFEHPIKGAKVVVQSEVPEYFKALLKKLEVSGR